jgi:hypothetical protein
MTTETTDSVDVDPARRGTTEDSVLVRARAAAEALRRRPALLTGLAGLVGVVLTVVIMPPPMYGDSQWVWRAAHMWPSIPADFPPTVTHHAMRLGTVLPVKLAQLILGDNQVAWVVASALLLSLFTAGAFAAGRSLFSTWVGVGTVVLLAIHPFFTDIDDYTGSVNTSTGGLVPDAPAAGLYALGVAAFVVASRRKAALQVRWLVAGGVCMGLAYLTREFVAFMFAAIPVYFLLLRIPWRRLVFPAIPMAGLLAFELVHNAIVWGDPLARLKVAGEHSAPLAAPRSLRFVLGGFYDAMNWDRLGWLFLICLALTVVGAAVFRDRRLILLLVWFASLWVPLTLLGGLLNPADPNLRIFLVRYWTAIFAPLVVGGLATVGLIVERVRRSQFDHRPVAVVAALAVMLYGILAADVLTKVRRDEDWRGLRSWLAAHPEVTTIYTDDRTAETAEFYTITPTGDRIWSGSFQTFHYRVQVLPADQIGHTPYLQSRHGAREKPSTANGWRILWRSDNKVLTIWQR